MGVHVSERSKHKVHPRETSVLVNLSTVEFYEKDTTGLNLLQKGNN